MIVVDASVLVLPYLGHDPRARAAEVRLGEAELAAPEVIDLEFAQAIRRLVRRGLISTPRGALAIARIAEMPIEHFPHRTLLPRVWELRDNLSAYDASYVALAEFLGATLVTGDVRLANAPGIRCNVEVVR